VSLWRLDAGVLLTFALVAPAMSQPSDTKTLRIVPFADLQTIDPINTTVGNVQSHGVMIYDFLFGRDDAQGVKPQMVKTWFMSPDGLLWQFTLREGLAFHDDSPVTSDDVIASLKRWGARDPYGRLLMAATDRMTALDADTFEWKLKRPYGLMLEALSKSGSNIPAIMPKHIAATDPFKNIEDATGSGPFIFVKTGWGAQTKIRRCTCCSPGGTVCRHRIRSVRAAIRHGLDGPAIRRTRPSSTNSAAPPTQPNAKGYRLTFKTGVPRLV
jgi:peptide/nickel transport system substrate-binding protein